MNNEKQPRSRLAPSLASIFPADRILQERIRLLLQAKVYDPLTRRFLVEAGIRPGMRVLDVGSGIGSVSILASELVEPRGTVVGIESNPAMVELARRRARGTRKTNITYVQGDVESMDLTGRFDAIVGRFVLRELRDAASSLRKLMRALAPAGIVAFQEKVLAIPVISLPRMPAVEKARTWMDEARRRAGVDVAMGAKLAKVFVVAGLPSPSLRLDAPVGHGAKWVGYEYLVETLRGMLPLMYLYDIASEREIAIERLAEEMRADATERECLVILTPCVGAW